MENYSLLNRIKNCINKRTILIGIIISVGITSVTLEQKVQKSLNDNFIQSYSINLRFNHDLSNVSRQEAKKLMGSAKKLYPNLVDKGYIKISSGYIDKLLGEYKLTLDPENIKNPAELFEGIIKDSGINHEGYHLIMF